MGPVVDRDLPGFQHTLAVNLVQTLAEVLLASQAYVCSTVAHVDVFVRGGAWWDNWQDFLGRAGSKI